MYFYDVEKKMSEFWTSKGCDIIKPFIDANIGAATYHPEGTFFQCLKQEHSKIAFLQQCNRPDDGAEGAFIDNSRSNLFFQYQVLITPADHLDKFGIDLVKESLNYISPGFSDHNTIDVYEDNWKSPSIGAFGLGYELRVNGLEVAQITYIQKMGGVELQVPSLEIAYGFDRIVMILQDKKGIKEIEISDGVLLREHIKEIPINIGKPIVEAFKLFDLENPIKKEFPNKDERKEYLKLIKMIHIFNCILATGTISHSDREDMMNNFMKRIGYIAKSFINNNNISFIGGDKDINIIKSYSQYNVLNFYAEYEQIDLDYSKLVVSNILNNAIAQILKIDVSNNKDLYIKFNSESINIKLFIPLNQVDIKGPKIISISDDNIPLVKFIEKNSKGKFGKDNIKDLIKDGYITVSEFKKFFIKEVKNKENHIFYSKSTVIDEYDEVKNFFIDIINSMSFNLPSMKCSLNDFSFIRPIKQATLSIGEIECSFNRNNMKKNMLSLYDYDYKHKKVIFNDIPIKLGEGLFNSGYNNSINIEIDFDSYKDISLNTLKSLYNDVFKYSVFNKKEIIIPVSLSDDVIKENIKSKILRSISFNIEKYIYIYSKDKDLLKDITSEDQDLSTSLKNIAPKYDKIFNNIDLVFKYNKELLKLNLADEYGIDSEIFKSARSDLFEYKFGKSDIFNIQVSICNIILQFKNLEEYGFESSKFYRKYIAEIVNEIIFISNTYKNNSGELIDYIINNIDCFILIDRDKIRQIAEKILDRYCIELCLNRNSEDISGIVFNMSNNSYNKDKLSNIELASSLLEPGILKEIYNISILSKRLIPKAIEIGFNDDTQPIKISKDSIMFEIESARDLTKPLDDFSNKEKSKLLSFVKKYNWIYCRLNFTNVLPDIYRIYGNE